jgi:DNA-3-methyladenine glycosylase II
MRSLTIQPQGPFDLATARDFAGGFPAGLGATTSGEGAILMAFPVEGWTASAVVQLEQDAQGRLVGPVFGEGDLPTIERQAARSLSIDVDGRAWPDVGRRDPVIGRLQAEHGLLRPVCFYSAYEAATSFVIGHRISMSQARRIKERLGDLAGDRVDVEIAGERRTIRPFPRPQALLALPSVPGLAPVKVERLHALATAALEGRLDTERLGAIPEDEALAELRSLPGVGPWTATAILTRGCGVADVLPLGDTISRESVAHFYDLPSAPDDDTWETIAEAWRPYRMWASVLLHMAWRRGQPARPSYRQQRPARVAETSTRDRS